MRGRIAAAAAGLFAAGLLFGAAFGAKAHKTDASALYPRGGTIVSIDDHNDVVTWKDCAGLYWSFYGVEDWMVGDYVSAIMDQNGTPHDITDDVIVDIRYAG